MSKKEYYIELLLNYQIMDYDDLKEKNLDELEELYTEVQVHFEDADDDYLFYD